MDDLILHPRTHDLLTKIADHLPHGLIIDGPRGVGVTAVAKAISKHLGSPDLAILSKKKIKGEYAVDLKDGSIIIDDIRQLYEQTRTKQPGKQIYIIDTGEKSMTAAAQNAFLKLLEEPRMGVHFIISTHQFDRLLPTIVSRSQRLSLLPISDEQTRGLINSLNISDETKRARLAFVGQGLPALIKRLASDDQAYEARVAIMRDAKTMISGSIYDKLSTIYKYRDDRPDSLTLIDDVNHQLRTVLRSQPDARIVKNIETYLNIRQRIADGGSIRLQLTSAVL
jgi:DNA polymerase-3 subunit delta'